MDILWKQLKIWLSYWTVGWTESEWNFTLNTTTESLGPRLSCEFMTIFSVGKATNQHGARKLVNLHGLPTQEVPTIIQHSMHANKFQISWMATSWSLFVRPLPATSLLKLLLLSMCNLQGVGTGGEESVRQAIWFCYLFGCHFQVFKFGIAITQHFQWEDTG